MAQKIFDKNNQNNNGKWNLEEFQKLLFDIIRSLDDRITLAEVEEKITQFNKVDITFE